MKSAIGKQKAGGWQQFGKLLMRWVAGKLELRCPRCALNIKVDKKEIESIVTRELTRREPEAAKAARRVRTTGVAAVLTDVKSPPA